MWRSAYLGILAAVLLLLNLVNTTGEYILDQLVLDAASVAARGPEAQSAYVGSFYGEYFFQ